MAQLDDDRPTRMSGATGGDESPGQARRGDAEDESAQSEADEEVRRRAYDRYLSRGGSHGSDMDDWLSAEREVRERSAPAGDSGDAGRAERQMRADGGSEGAPEGRSMRDAPDSQRSTHDESSGEAPAKSARRSTGKPRTSRARRGRTDGDARAD